MIDFNDEIDADEAMELADMFKPEPVDLSHSTRAPQYGHLRFVGGRILCPRMRHRTDLGPDHRYGQEFVCPDCGVRVPASLVAADHQHQPGESTS